jgi:hypothetical protein
MRRESWRPPLDGRDLVLVVTVHATVWLAPILAYVLLVDDALGWLATPFVGVPLSFATMWLGDRVARRVASWRVQSALVRALRREQG